MLAIFALACGCTDGPMAPTLAPEPGLLSAEYECRIDLKANTMECGLPSWAGGPGGSRPDLLLYASGAKAVIVSGPTYSRANSSNPDTVTYSLAILNLLPQPIGTTDGVTADPGGNRFVITGYVQAAANATLDNADGTATFVDSVNAGGPYTYANRQYISYPGVLAPNDTSQARTLRFIYNPTVTTINIKYRISAPVQYHYGVVVISPAELVMGAGQTTTLSGTSFSAVGAPLSAEAFTWSSSNTTVAMVNASTGVITAVSGGTAIMTATSMADERRMGTRSVTVIQANVDAFPETISGPINSEDIYPAFSVTTNDVVIASTVISFAGWNGVPGKSMQGGDLVMTASGMGMGRFTYSPPPAYSGTDSLEYTIQSGSATSSAKLALPVIQLDEAPEILSTTPGEGAEPVAANDDIMIFFSEAVNVSTSSFLLECPIGEEPQTFSVDGSGTSTITLDPDADLPEQAICTVTILASVVSDVDVNDGPDVMEADHVFSFEVGITIHP